MKTKARSATKKLPRLMYNDDSCTLRTVPPPHTVESISHALDYLRGTQVDCLCWCLGEQIAYSWPSKVMENYYDLHDKGAELTKGWNFDRNVMATLHKQGIDYLPILIERAHAQGLTFIGSFRMNDTHLKSYPNSILAPEFWKNNQQYRVWDAAVGKGYYSAALDYSYPEVRNRYRDAIEEVAETYDVDGIELDFTRTPFLFQPSEAWRKRGIATRFVRDIRDRLARIGQRRGRPFTLVIRINSLEYFLKAGGIDARRWIEEKLADLFVISEHYNDYNQDITPWRELCRAAGVPLYPAVEVDPMSNRTEYFSPLPRIPFLPRHDGAVPYSTSERMRVQRAAAQNLLAQEPDGLYLFNFPCTLVEGANLLHNQPTEGHRLASLLGEMGSLRTLAKKNKLFPFYHDLPITVESNRPRRFHQTIRFAIRGNDVGAADVTLRFRQAVERNPHADGDFRQSPYIKRGIIHYYLNDQEITEGQLTRTKAPAGRIRSGFLLNKHELIEFRLPGRALRNGINELAFEIPHFPHENDPYIYIYELEVELGFGEAN